MSSFETEIKHRPDLERSLQVLDSIGDPGDAVDPIAQWDGLQTAIGEDFAKIDRDRSNRLRPSIERSVDRISVAQGTFAFTKKDQEPGRDRRNQTGGPRKSIRDRTHHAGTDPNPEGVLDRRWRKDGGGRGFGSRQSKPGKQQGQQDEGSNWAKKNRHIGMLERLELP